jgi:hypothetical protein
LRDRRIRPAIHGEASGDARNGDTRIWPKFGQGFRRRGRGLGFGKLDPP